MRKVAILNTGKDQYVIYIVTSRYFGYIFMVTKNGDPFASEKSYEDSVQRIANTYPQHMGNS